MRYQTERTPSLANPPVGTTPPGTRFTEPLHGILPRNNQIYATSTSMVSTLLRGHNHREHSAAASRARQFSNQVSDARSIIGIGSSALTEVSDLIKLTVSDLIWLTVPDLIWLTYSDLIWLIISDLIWLTVFDSIWLNFSPIWFDSYLTHSFYIWVT